MIGGHNIGGSSHGDEEVVINAVFRAVILQHIQDYKNKARKPCERVWKREAEYWLFHDNVGFREVCELAGWSPEWVRRNIIEAAARGFVPQKRKGVKVYARRSNRRKKQLTFAY